MKSRVPGVVVTVGGSFAAAIGLTLSACAASGGLNTSAESAVIAVQATQLSVEIENKAGLPLTNVDVAILPVGGVMEFSKYFGRLENAEKREYALGEFRGRDGTSFNLRVIRPKTIRVTAKDLKDKAYKVEVPWR